MLKKHNICVITPPLGKASLTPLKNTLDLLLPLSNNLYIITSGEGSSLTNYYKDIIFINYIYKLQHNILFTIINNIYIQLYISYYIFVIRKKIDIFLFGIDSHVYILPVFMVKLLRKKIVSILPASMKISTESNNDNLSKIFVYFESITLMLSDYIILYTKSLKKKWNLEKFDNKIYYAFHHHLDFNEFKVIKEYDNRDMIIGYFGRLREEKGIMNFLKSIPIIISYQPGYKFIIGGDGPLEENIRKYIQDNKLFDHVKLLGWIPHDVLPINLNELKMIVIPSYSEGLPNIMIEAMACGTPVLTTPVGSISDLIHDSQNGFIMENNSPDSIAKNILYIIQNYDLKTISQNSVSYAMTNFNYDVVLANHKKLYDIVDGISTD